MKYSSIDVVDRFKLFDLQKNLERHKLVLQVPLFTLFSSEKFISSYSLSTYIDYSDLHASLTYRGGARGGLGGYSPPRRRKFWVLVGGTLAK